MDIEIKNEIMNLIGDSLECPANIEGLNKIIELIQIYEDRIITCKDNKTKISEYKLLLNHIKYKLNKKG